MAKIGLTKLGLTKNTEVEIVEWNEQKIEVKQYLPIEDKLDLIGNIINLSVDDNGYYNPAKVYIYTILEILYAYTNINFTDKQKEDVAKLYDLLEENGIVNKIMATIPTEEYEFIINGIDSIIQSFYTYRNSIYGILDSVSQDYANLDFDAQKIQKMIGDPENLQLLRDVLNKLG